MVKKLWLHASWRSHRGMPCAEFGWPRDWAQALYASWTMQHFCICAWASMVYLKACVMWNCIAGLPGDLSVGPIARPNWSDINNISSAYKMHVQYAVCTLLCCMYAAYTIKRSDKLAIAFARSDLIACQMQLQYVWHVSRPKPPAHIVK